MTEVPISCVDCGVRLGLGLPGASTPCWNCGCFVATKIVNDEFDGAIEAVAVVAVVAVLAVVGLTLLAAALGGSSRG